MAVREMRGVCYFLNKFYIFDHQSKPVINSNRMKGGVGGQVY
jgi:hypothetical protein